jgi:hypothetical protein
MQPTSAKCIKPVCDWCPALVCRVLLDSMTCSENCVDLKEVIVTTLIKEVLTSLLEL